MSVLSVLRAFPCDEICRICMGIPNEQGGKLGMGVEEQSVDNELRVVVTQFAPGSVAQRAGACFRPGMSRTMFL